MSAGLMSVMLRMQADGGRVPISVSIDELLAMLEEAPALAEKCIGGKPWGLVCRPEQQTKYRPIATFHGLTLIPSEECQTADCVVIHYGERERWQFGAKEAE